MREEYLLALADDDVAAGHVPSRWQSDADDPQRLRYRPTTRDAFGVDRPRAQLVLAGCYGRERFVEAQATHRAQLGSAVGGLQSELVVVSRRDRAECEARYGDRISR